LPIKYRDLLSATGVIPTIVRGFSSAGSSGGICSSSSDESSPFPFRLLFF